MHSRTTSVHEADRGKLGKGQASMVTLTASVFGDIFQDNPLNLLYAAALFVGAMYAAFLMFFHGIGDVLGDFHFDVHVDHDMADMHLIDAHGAHQATGVSTLAIASFISSFGAFGLIAVTLLSAGTATSLIAALFGGVVVGIAAQIFFLYILSPTISSEVRQARLIGMVGELWL